jgi:guanylate kinase
MKKGKLVLLIGPSGVGKSVILKKLRERNPDLHFPRSATTRQRRLHESNELYHFVTDDEFDQFIRDGKLIEWATVHGGARYGTLKEEIIPFIEKGKIVVREVDVQGFESIRSDPLFRNGQAPYRLESIFILPENKEQLIKRITKRAPISDEELGRRVRSMDEELRHADMCTAKVVNREGKMEETVKEAENVISKTN